MQATWLYRGCEPTQGRRRAKDSEEEGILCEIVSEDLAGQRAVTQAPYEGMRECLVC